MEEEEGKKDEKGNRGGGGGGGVTTVRVAQLVQARCLPVDLFTSANHFQNAASLPTANKATRGAVCRGLTRCSRVVSPAPRNPGPCVDKAPGTPRHAPAGQRQGATGHTPAVWLAGHFLGASGLMIYLPGAPQRGPQAPPPPGT